MPKNLDGHADDDPVVFGYASTVNISFSGAIESGYTWGDWREMSEADKDAARQEFIYDTLGVEVYEK